MEDPKPDWPAVISDICGPSGPMTQAEVVAEVKSRGVDCAQGTLGDLLSNDTKQPRYALGVVLMQIHKRVMRKAARAAPANDQRQATAA